MNYPSFGRAADSALPAEGTPAYWHLITSVGAAFIAGARSGVVNREAIGIVAALQARYRNGTLDLAAALLYDALVRCPPERRTSEGLPDLDLLAPDSTDAVTVLEATSKTNAIFGRRTVTAADIEHTEEQQRAHDRTRDLVTAAWTSAASAPAPEAMRSKIRSCLSPLEGDARGSAAVLALAASAVVRVG